MPKKRKQKSWSYKAGGRGHRVRVYESKPEGVIYAAAWDTAAKGGRGAECKRSLGHCDRDEAERYALEQAAKLKAGLEDVRSTRPTLGRVLRLYLSEVTPSKSPTEQRSDDRRAELFVRVLGSSRDMERLSRRDWDGFIRARSTGAIDARGHPVEEEKRRAVRNRAVAADLVFLRGVVNWANRWRNESGQLLMRDNPLKGLPLPEEKNPRRPVASDDRYEAVRAVSDEVTMNVVEGGERRKVRSYLQELLEIKRGAGRRITPICSLRYHDLRLTKTPEAPWGGIRWPDDTDKKGKEWIAPISPEVRATLERILRERPGIGSAPIFPAPGDPSKPVSRYMADRWLRRAEKLARLESQEGSLWHAYRRAWVTKRKHLPDVDVAAAGGWSDTRSLKTAYQQVDSETMLRVVTEPAELREVR